MLTADDKRHVYLAYSELLADYSLEQSLSVEPSDFSNGIVGQFRESVLFSVELLTVGLHAVLLKAATRTGVAAFEIVSKNGCDRAAITFANNIQVVMTVPLSGWIQHR